MQRLIIALSMLLTGFGTHAQDQETKRAMRLGNAAYRQGQHGAAAEQYARAGQDRHAALNLGNAWLRSDSTVRAQEGPKSKPKPTITWATVG